MGGSNYSNVSFTTQSLEAPMGEVIISDHIWLCCSFQFHMHTFDSMGVTTSLRDLLTQMSVLVEVSEMKKLKVD